MIKRLPHWWQLACRVGILRCMYHDDAMTTTILIRGGNIVDGTGTPARRADVLVSGGTITAVGNVGHGPSGTVVYEAHGAVVAPGFIDAHAHDDHALLERGGTLAKLARAAFRRGKVFSIHIRNEYDGMWAALDEAFAIARDALGTSPPAGARLVLSHQKCAGSDWNEPRRLARGIELVLVGGRRVDPS